MHLNYGCGLRLLFVRLTRTKEERSAAYSFAGISRSLDRRSSLCIDRTSTDYSLRLVIYRLLLVYWQSFMRGES